MSGAADSNNRVPQSVDTIKQMFQDTGILEYEPQLPAQVCDIAHALTKQVLAEARSVSEFSGKKQVDITDVEFALKALNEKHIALRPPKSFMTELAMEKNAHPLPPIRQNYGLRLPNDRFCQLQQNYEYVGTQSSSRSDGERENKTSQVNKEGQRKFIASAPTNVDNFNPELVSNILMGRPKHSIATDGSRKRPYLEENNSDQRADVEDDYDYD